MGPRLREQTSNSAGTLAGPFFPANSKKQNGADSAESARKDTAAAMVHSAFHIEPVLKKSAYRITALEVWGERLVIATEEGVLLLLREQEGAHIVEFEVEETRRNFSKQPVVHMRVAEELGVLVCLTAEVVQINQLPSLDMSAQLLKTRGAHSFVLSMDLSPAVLSVAVRNKLLLFRWDGTGFSDWKEISLPEIATNHVACGNSICVAAGKRYILFDLFTGAQKDLFDSNSAAPSAFCLPASSSKVSSDKRELLLGRDNMSVFQDSQGRPSRKYGITWAEPASNLLCLSPYILGVLPKVVEVKLLDTQATVQSLSLRASHVRARPDSTAAFVVANNCIYRLRPVAMTRQVDALLEGEQYETCLALCERCAPTDAAVAAKAPAVYRAFALKLFTKMEFDKAMGLLARCPPAVVDPRQVLLLFPDLALASVELSPDMEEAAATGAALKGHKLLRAQVHLSRILSLLSVSFSY